MDDLVSSIATGTISQTIMGPVDIIVALTVAMLLGGVHAAIYRYTLTGKRIFTPQMAYTLALLCLGGALIWLVIGNSLVRAFGLGGALALIRYRTRVRDPKDMPLVLFAMITGMACGLDQYFIAITGTLFIGIILFIIKIDWNNRIKREEAMDIEGRPEVIDAWTDLN